jgi:hypothetical protein
MLRYAKLLSSILQQELHIILYYLSFSCMLRGSFRQKQADRQAFRYINTEAFLGGGEGGRTLGFYLARAPNMVRAMP